MEADHSHQGNPQHIVLPNLLASDGRLATFREKVVARSVALDPKVCKESPWDCERNQRNAILDVAIEAGMEAGKDILFSGDADEMPSRKTYAMFARCDVGEGLSVVELVFHQYSFSWEYPPWGHLLVAPSEFWLEEGAPTLSSARRTHPKPWRLFGGPDSGWHLSYFGGPRVVQRKLLDFAHTELAKPPYTDLAYIRQGIEDGFVVHRKSSLTPTINIFRPRILGVSSRFRCWENPLDEDACRGNMEMGIASVPRQDCQGRFVSARLAGHSGGLQMMSRLSTHNLDILKQQRKQQLSCEASYEPTRFLICNLNFQSYFRRERFRSRAVRILFSGKHFANITSFTLCVPVKCLADGEALLALAQEHFFEIVTASIRLRGFLSELPPWRSEDARFEAMPPVALRRSRSSLMPLPLLAKTRVGTDGDRRLALALVSSHWLAPVGATLHTWFGSLRRAQVQARVTAIVHGVQAEAECSDIADTYEVDCVSMASLGFDGPVWRPAHISARLWRAAEKYLRDFAPLVEEVWVGDANDVLFQSDPFLARPFSRDPYLMIGAEPTNILMGELISHRRTCLRCADQGLLQRAACSEIEGLPILVNGSVMGSRDMMLMFLRAWSGLTLRVRDGCDEQVMLNARVWTGELAAGLMPIVALTEGSAICYVGASHFVHVGSSGDVLNRLGQRCAVVGRYKRWWQVEWLAQRHLPGKRDDSSLLPLLPFRVRNQDTLAHAEFSTVTGPICHSRYRMSPPHNFSRCGGDMVHTLTRFVRVSEVMSRGILKTKSHTE
eukprot:TRINITY_DN54836_c0_g1_i1.p1 TRINITY_DN54836_c0_g1~~TRINITY_DN54836_c0_g1_i1.p1  ORF type:complete len:900 (-),score=71.40 TRINITY_DN54836_c0_g1_i1:16-2358(-)